MKVIIKYNQEKDMLGVFSKETKELYFYISREFLEDLFPVVKSNERGYIGEIKDGKLSFDKCI